MTKRSSAPARTLAVIALIGGFVLLIAIFASALGGDSGDSGGKASGGKVSREAGTHKKTPASYVIQNGDTLIAIAHQTGVSVAEIERLNPEVDPQILVSGEKLKLR